MVSREDCPDNWHGPYKDGRCVDCGVKEPKPPVLGVLTGQVPVRSMPVATKAEPPEETDTDERDA